MDCCSVLYYHEAPSDSYAWRLSASPPFPVTAGLVWGIEKGALLSYPRASREVPIGDAGFLYGVASVLSLTLAAEKSNRSATVVPSQNTW